MDGRFRLARVLAWTCLPLVPGLCGCLGSSRANRHGELAVSPRPYVRDVPLPSGFRLVDQSSEDWSSGRQRYLRHRYRGRSDKLQVRGFYRRQMPLARWSPVDEGSVDGRCTMRFERGAEVCTITVEEGVPRWLGRVAVQVIISPIAGQGATQSRKGAETKP